MSNIKSNDPRPRIYLKQTQAGNKKFDFPFMIESASDLKVSVNGTSPTIQGYLVENIGKNGGGHITMTQAPLINDEIVIWRDMPIQRQSTFTEHHAFKASALNKELNHVTLLMQQLKLLESDCLRRQPQDRDISLILPMANERAHKRIQFNEKGELHLIKDEGITFQTLKKQEEAVQSFIVKMEQTIGKQKIINQKALSSISVLEKKASQIQINADQKLQNSLKNFEKKQTTLVQKNQSAVTALEQKASQIQINADQKLQNSLKNFEKKQTTLVQKNQSAVTALEQKASQIQTNADQKLQNSLKNFEKKQITLVQKNQSAVTALEQKASQIQINADQKLQNSLNILEQKIKEIQANFEKKTENTLIALAKKHLPPAAPTTPPSAAPTTPPSAAPTTPPPAAPSTPPSAAPTTPPSAAPTTPPSAAPTTPPSAAPTTPPSAAPTTPPSAAPSTPPPAAPTTPPSAAPTTPPWY